MRIKFKEYIGESPQAIINDWSGFRKKLNHLTKKELENWEMKSEIGSLKVYKNKNKYILGQMITDIFVVYTTLKVLERNDLKPFFKKPIQMSEVETDLKHRGNGYGRLMYKFILDSGYDLISDNTQYNGARKIYDSLERDINIKADLFDDHKKEFIKRDIRVDSGEENWDFDTDIWSYDTEKSHILICLSKV